MHKTYKLAACSLIVTLSVASCDQVVDPDLPSSATSFTPPPAYTLWWKMTEACSGVSGSFADVEWYQVPDGVPLELDGEPVSAYWSAGSNRVTVSSGLVRNGQIIRHEMLHALMKSKGHPRDAFLEACAGTVECTLKCVVDAGAGAVVSPADASPSDLEVTAIMDPVQPKGSINGGYFKITVAARNPRAQRIKVQLPAAPTLGGSASHPVSFACVISGVGGESNEVRALDHHASNFAAGETKIHVFDYFIGDGALPGQVFSRVTYKALCGYGGNRAAEINFFPL